MGNLCAQIPLLLQSFDTLGLSAPLLKSITEIGFETPTDAKPGNPMGAGMAKKKEKKKPAFKPSQEPWNTAGSGGAPGFSVKKKGKKKRY